MRVAIFENDSIDLDNSYLHSLGESDNLEIEGTDKVKGTDKVNGVVVFDKNKRILPLVSDWLNQELLSNNSALGTIDTYGKNMSYLVEYLSKQSLYKKLPLDESLLDIQPHTLSEYFAYLKNERGLSSKTIRNRDASFQQFFNSYLCIPRRNGNAKREDNPYSNGLLSGDAKSKIVEMCSLNELMALQLVSHSERERVLIQFMFDTGLRRLEVTRVKKSHIDTAINTDKSNLILDDCTVAIPSPYKALFVAGAKGRKREVKPRFTLPSTHTLMRLKKYFSSPEYRRLSRQHGSNPPAFINSQGAPYNVSSINKLLHRLSVRAIKRGLIDRAITPHMLRHGFAGSLLRSPDLGEHTVDKLVVLQNCLGHSKLTTTQIYTSFPYDIYGQYADKNGELMTREQLMALVNIKTKKLVPLRGK